jgi:competence protein ComEC
MEGERTAGAHDERLILSHAATDTPASPVAAARAPLPAEPAPAAVADRRDRSTPLAAFREKAARAIETEAARGTGFVIVPVLLAAGAVIYFCLPAEPPLPMLLGSMLLVLVAIMLAGRAQHAHALGIAVLALLAGMLAGSLETWRHSTQMMGSSISTRVTGRVVAIESRANGRVRLTIDLISTERPELRYAPDRFRATTGKLPEDLRPGDGVTGVVRLLSPSGPARPHGYDFAFENFFDGIGANGFFLSGPFRAEIGNAPSAFGSVASWVERQRLALADRIKTHIAGPEGEVAVALVAGVRGGIPEEVTEALRKTGLAHILAISGLHMALVAGTVVGAMRLSFALLPGFSSRHAVKKYAALAGLVALTLYLVISGAAVAAQRAYVMFAVMLVAVLFDRAALTMRNLAIAALIILLIAPHEVMGPSFQMSFAATAALIGAYGWYSERRSRKPPAGWARRSPVVHAVRLVSLFFVGLAATSIIAGLATGIFAAWHFQRVAPLGLVANLAAMPIVTIAVMPLAVAGMIAMPLGLDGPFFAGMGKALATVISIAEWLAERSPLDVVGAIPPLAVIMLAVALVTAVVLTTWLRAIALPFAAAGVALITMRELPDLLVSEDARLVAMPMRDGRLAISKTRPPTFTLGIWKAALNADKVLKPQNVDGRFTFQGSSSAEAAFSCADDLCLARHASDAVVAFANTAQAAGAACGLASLIVVDDATAKNVCAGTRARVVNKRELAWRGSAAVKFEDGAAQLDYAIGPTLRPWHDHRRYSREARGLPPYRRQKAEADQ